MNGNEAVLSINATLGKLAFEEAEGDLEAKVKASMRAVIRENWMATTDDELFRAGVGGALIGLKAGPDYERVRRSMEALRRMSAALSAAQAGVSVDFGSVLPDEDEEQPLPLLPWFREVKAAERP